MESGVTNNRPLAPMLAVIGLAIVVAVLLVHRYSTEPSPATALPATTQPFVPTTGPTAGPFLIPLAIVLPLLIATKIRRYRYQRKLVEGSSEEQ